MVSLDSSLGIQIVNFLVLILILNLLLYKPILGMIAKRKKQFAESEEAIKRLKETVDEQMAAYEAKLLQAKSEAMEQKNGIINQGATEAAAIIETVRGEIPALAEQFQARMDHQIAAAKNILNDRSRQLSLDIAEKILERRLR